MGLRLFIFCLLALPQILLAGRMKDLYFDHERSVSLKLWGTEEPESGFRLEKTRFVKATPPHQIAVSSDIQFYDSAIQKFYWITCTTQFSQLAETGRYRPSTVACLRP
jgi:hypothetical protein